VRPFSLEIDDGVSYFLVLRRNDVTKPMVRLFSDWLLQEMRVLAETCARLRQPRACARGKDQVVGPNGSKP
jgi:hypothetical protein